MKILRLVMDSLGASPFRHDYVEMAESSHQFAASALISTSSFLPYLNEGSSRHFFCVTSNYCSKILLTKNDGYLTTP